MSNKRSIGIYTNDEISKESIDFIRQFFGAAMEDLFIVTNNMYVCDDINIAIIPSIHMKFFDGVLIFTNMSELEEAVQQIKSSEIFYLVNNTLSNINKKELLNEL